MIFSKKSLERLSTIHPELQRLFLAVIEQYDCTIICGFRNKEDQEQALREGRTTKAWPDSKHNRFPSLAVDAAPYPINWKKHNQFYHFAGFVQAVAKQMNIAIRWGGDFNQNQNVNDENFVDLPHFELVGEQYD